MSVRRTIPRLALAALIAVLVWGFWLEPSSLRVRDEAPAVSWPYARPLRVAVLSDLHVGSPYYGVSRLSEIVARTNAAHPDIICLLGDFVTLGVIGGHFVPPPPEQANGWHPPCRRDNRPWRWVPGCVRG